jgi:hypothetical protein
MQWIVGTNWTRTKPRLDLAKAARDKKKADKSKRQPSSKETKAYTATVASNKALVAAAAASDSDYSMCLSYVSTRLRV